MFGQFSIPKLISLIVNPGLVSWWSEGVLYVLKQPLRAFCRLGGVICD